MLKWVEDLHKGFITGYYSKRMVIEIAASALLLGSFITLALVCIFDSQRQWVGLKGVAAVGLVALVTRASVSTWIALGSGGHDRALRI